MKQLKFAVLAVFLLFSIVSCDKDTDTTSDTNSISSVSEPRSKINDDRDQNLLQSFYQDILSLQSQSGFYDEFYLQHGYFDWPNFQSYENPTGDPILVMPVVKSHLTPSSGIMIYRQNSTNKKFSYVSRAELLNSIQDVEINQILKSQCDFLLLSDIKRGLGGDKELLSTTRDGETDTEPPCDGGEFVTICVKFDNSNADFAQEHDNFESFLKEQIKNLNLSANISDSEWAKWYAAFDGLASYSLSDLDLYSSISEFYNLTFGVFDPDRALEMYNLYKLMRFSYFETFDFGKDDVLGTYITNTTSNSYFECFDIWIWCWDEYPDFELTGFVVIPGPTGTSIPPFQKNHDKLMFCEGYLEPHDTGEDNPDSVHPNFEFCEIWMTYLEDCILPNATLIEGYGGGYSNLIMQWAQFQYYYPDDFAEAIADSEDCGTTTTEVEENNPPSPIAEECMDALNDFEKEYGLDLTIEERKAILFNIDSTSCDALFVSRTWKELIDFRTGYTQTKFDISFLYDFLSTSYSKKELLDYYETITQLRINEPLIRWDRSTELFDLFNSENDNILISDCGDVSPWSDLASFVIPAEVNNRVTSLGWTNQDIEMGNTKQVNLDYHSVNITTLPDINGDGVATEQELFDEIRLNFPNYANGEINVAINNGPDAIVEATWSFYNNDYYDIWNTNNGLKAIVEIDTEDINDNPIPGITDDATVICSSYENECCWVFSTIWTKQGLAANSNNGSHPVSGNRQFGIKQLSDGSYEFYIRAADRARINWLVNGLATVLGNNATEIFYEITDQSWNNLTSKIASLVNQSNYGGEATQNQSIIQRPNWNEVKDKLKSYFPLSSIPCKY